MMPEFATLPPELIVKCPPELTVKYPPDLTTSVPPAPRATLPPELITTTSPGSMVTVFPDVINAVSAVPGKDDVPHVEGLSQFPLVVALNAVACASGIANNDNVKSKTADIDT